MNVLVIGSGGREHALSKKISESKLVENIFVAPGNAGTGKEFINVDISPIDFKKIANFIENNNINMLVVGPEEPLVKGIRDYLENDKKISNLLIIGPSAYASQLEGSKDFAKEFMKRHKIPTAKYFKATKDNLEDAFSYLEEMNPPFVLKADGLAAGKGVIILDNILEARKELKSMINGKFGEASSKVLIEEYLNGIECSVFVLTDGKSYIMLPEAKDYKRVGEGNTGLNTGGMGAISPVPFFKDEFKQKVIKNIIEPTINGIYSEKMNYKGFIFFGLINVMNEPYVIEYNVRMGDPETEAVMPRIKSDFAEILMKTANSTLHESKIEISDETCATVMIVSGGYPENYDKNKPISGLENVKDSFVFHAGTKNHENKIITSGGRVIAISSLAKNLDLALQKTYSSISKIYFENMYFRRDIGFDLK